MVHVSEGNHNYFFRTNQLKKGGVHLGNSRQPNGKHSTYSYYTVLYSLSCGVVTEMMSLGGPSPTVSA